MKRLQLLAATVGLMSASAMAASGVVYKSPSCGCCDDWVEHMAQAGFELEVKPYDDMASIKQEMGVPAEMQSCHTARINGYVIEGHVPAKEVKKLLATHTGLEGLAVAGMPIGSPGMEYGDRHQPYTVMAFDDEGNTQAFQHYPKP
ncbi:DUF411 domain-containing protein [Salinivibrio kushneri]|uniref:DUF411 domain-containing protein n=1 Tax=Salinivibrio kushneri TaxID=1908198 RepID=A0AA47KLZ0_9GAMM|nr:DUF411 domain-containing protein [Salinivibrio kushneri]WBA09356.1 DUF411 domain-containing protein [Salinivibrio kushneri]